MRPGVGETLLILDDPREMQAFSIGQTLLVDCRVAGSGTFEEKFSEEVSSYRDEQPFIFPVPEQGEIFIDNDNYHTARLVFESISALRNHNNFRKLLQKYRFRRTANKVLIQLVTQKQLYDSMQY